MKERLSLTDDGVEMVDYPLHLQQKIARAASAWQMFLTLDQTTKDRFAAQTLQSSVGYERKGSGERESRDIKENFDLTRDSLANLRAKVIEQTSQAAMFIDSASTLFDGLEEFIAGQGKHIETSYEVPGFFDETFASAGSAFVRFLYYPPVDKDTMIGEPHVDHSGFTLHLYESTDGCERLDPHTREWLPMPVADDQAAMFASMQTQLFSKGKVLGLCHRILANDTTRQAGRTAIVCFVPLVTTPSYDRETHGRLQTKTPGFNYDMPLREFEKLFKSR